MTFKHPDYLKGYEDNLLIHAGDITEYGTEAETNDFLKWFAKLNIKHKLFIGGNHDLFLESCTPAQLRKLIPEGVIYLNNSGVEINGVTKKGIEKEGAGNKVNVSEKEMDALNKCTQYGYNMNVHHYKKIWNVLLNCVYVLVDENNNADSIVSTIVSCSLLYGSGK